MGSGRTIDLNWQQFIMDLEGLDHDQVEMIFERHGACSITLSDASDNPILEPAPGETPLWQDVRMTGLFSSNTDLESLVRDLKQDLPLAELPPYRVESLGERDWEREWLKDFGAMQFGDRLWVCPGDTESASRVGPEAAVVRLDPGLAFGTGTHATTALCLDWLDGLDLIGRRVLDYGCGSGILALAALKLGASAVTGMDIDAQARTATRQNAERNAVSGQLEILGSDAEIEGKFEIVVANILAEPLVELVESLVTRLSSGGDLALSGILSGQVNKIRAAYRPWIAFDEPAYRSQSDQTWARLNGKRRLSR